MVGILQEKGGSGFQDPDDQVAHPGDHAAEVLLGLGRRAHHRRQRGVQPTASRKPRPPSRRLLRSEHELAATEDDDFEILDQAQLLETASAVSDTLTLMLAGIASISLIVGGIGIMNIMLVSVRERTREIGIRKSIGARSRDILAQFLVESVTLSLVGGLVGVVFGVAATFAIATFAGWDVAARPAHHRHRRRLQRGHRRHLRRLAGTPGRPARSHQRASP